MSVDLSKCLVGDKVQLRNGMVVEINFIDFGSEYPYKTEGISWDTYGFIWSSKDESLWDIVKVITPSKDKKVAKCRITDDFGRETIFSIDSFGIHSWPYTTRKNAIRGARRFCKRIGFECEIVD